MKVEKFPCGDKTNWRQQCWGKQLAAKVETFQFRRFKWNQNLRKGKQKYHHRFRCDKHSKDKQNKKPKSLISQGTWH